MTDWAKIIDSVGVALGGDRRRGQELLLESWHVTTPSQHAERCVLAHYLADTESDTEKEVAWDELALDEHRHVEDDALASIGVPSARGFEPSLRLNLADGYFRLGKIDAAREQLAAGQASAGTLDNDGYGSMIRAGLETLAQRMESAAGD